MAAASKMDVDLLNRRLASQRACPPLASPDDEAWAAGVEWRLQAERRLALSFSCVRAAQSAAQSAAAHVIQAACAAHAADACAAHAHAHAQAAVNNEARCKDEACRRDVVDDEAVFHRQEFRTARELLAMR
jgi:hypothetical protein